ncbi:MAG: hypothetical protein P8X63_10730, partial [Desulfuromonadaceae bacterium]
LCIGRTFLFSRPLPDQNTTKIIKANLAQPLLQVKTKFIQAPAPDYLNSNCGHESSSSPPLTSRNFSHQNRG